MGKSRRTKRSSRPEPIPTADDKHEEILEKDEEDVAGHETVLENIVSDLMSGSATDRECGCASLAMFAGKNHSEIIEKKVLKILAPLVLDPAPGVRHGALGALREISLAGNDVICDVMVDDDVMTPLVTLIQGYSEGQWSMSKAAGGCFATMDAKKEVMCNFLLEEKVFTTDHHPTSVALELVFMQFFYETFKT